MILIIVANIVGFKVYQQQNVNFLSFVKFWYCKLWVYELRLHIKDFPQATTVTVPFTLLKLQ